MSRRTAFVPDIDVRRFNRSAAKLSYGDAQKVIEGGSLGSVEVSPEHQATAIVKDIIELGVCCRHELRRRVSHASF